ncbi:MBOAT family O-acyltransferase [uncultured Tissierella sp.]|uniref:MBOAT family O-acyltransferase n=1 Tax=uncultured Tissierella sp. TaxID=448160 RepID=UPI0028051AC7|nr:MBOAT family O-acyltransferase [uncultured Tissierella sp.]MDU5081394.1 MBOAT family O-acyltransferase [Bacillota bacterium]
MLFNSVQFIIFFIVVTLVYYILPHRFRWVLLLVSSYYFYMAWKPVYILLILLCTIINYIAALIISKHKNQGIRKFWLVLSLGISFGVLFIYKYFSFLNDSLGNVFAYFNLNYPIGHFDILLPMGISFYTFQTLSYTIDVYRGDIKPEKNFFMLSLYVTFFPQLVAGPIERSDRLLPQLRKKAYFDIYRVLDGIKIMVIGFFKKIVIADRLAVAVNAVYNSPQDFSGIYYIIATILFAFQIYCDFSAYSEIALGAAKVLDIDLMRNFDRPYLSKSIQEFWRRWHISLSTWFRDYLYIPLGGNRVSKPRYYFNVLITFLLSGLWHGANWTFVIWGGLHGVYQIIAHMTKRVRSKVKSTLRLNNSFVLKLFQVIFTFTLVCFTWIFFRANSISDAIYIIENLFSDIDSWKDINYLYLVANNMGLSFFEFLLGIASIILLSIGELIARKRPLYLTLNNSNFIIEGSFYIILLLIILTMGVYFNANQFIYFQF